MEVYTIGHSNYPLERLIDMVKFYGIDCVIDIRGIPYSKYNIQYNKETIEKSLREAGFTYIYMAKEFAANRVNKESYNEIGYADFEKVIYEKDFFNGIERLKRGLDLGYNIVLLGAMQEPIRCHRGILVGRALRDRRFTVKHIMDDYSIAFQDELEEQLLEKYFSNRNQLSIDNLLGKGMDRKAMIEESYRLANKEIGYRVEHL